MLHKQYSYYHKKSTIKSHAATANKVHPPHVYCGVGQWLAGGSPDGPFASPGVAARDHKNLQ